MIKINKRNKKIIYWLVFNLGVYELFLIATAYNISGLINVSIFFYWFLSITGTLLIFLGDMSAKKVIEENPDFITTPIPQFIDVGFDIIVLTTLVYYGYNVLGVFYLLHIIGANVYRNSLEKYRLKNINKENKSKEK